MLCTNGKWRFSQSMAWLLNGMHYLARWSSLSSRFLIELSVCSALFSSVSDNLQIFFICFTTKSSVMITNCCFLSFRDEAFSGNDSLNINFLWYCWFPFPYYAQDLPLSIHPSSTFQKNLCPSDTTTADTYHSDFGSLSLWSKLVCVAFTSWTVLEEDSCFALTHILFGLV